MDHAQFITTLPPERKAALLAKSKIRGLVHLAAHLGILAAMAGYIAVQAPLWPLMLLPYGITMVFLFTLSHECTHKTPFAQTALSDIVGHAVSPLIALPFTWFRYYHLAHHKFTNDPASDPEIAGHPRPTTWPEYLVYLSGWGYWAGNAKLLWHHTQGRITAPYLPSRKHPAMRRDARILLALCGFTCWPNTASARPSPICLKTPALRSPIACCVFWRGICLTTPNITQCRWYHSTPCHPCTRKSRHTLNPSRPATAALPKPTSNP